MSKHIHLIIETLAGKETVSSIMQFIKAGIAERYNRSMNTTGAFRNERFGSTIIEGSSNPQQYFFWLLWHIAQVWKLYQTLPCQSHITPESGKKHPP